MAGFHRLGALARDLARELCDGRLVITQEGGYNAAYTAYCAYASLAGVSGHTLEIEDPLAFYPDDPERADSDVSDMVARHPLLH